MITFEEYRDQLLRQVVWRVVLRLDYCPLICGQSPCTAPGPPFCYYTYPTCLDPAHYSRGVKEYAFSLAEGPAVPDALPYLAGIKMVPTEIVPQDHITRRARLTLDFYDDTPFALANPDKTATNPETGGTFFRNFLARNPHAVGREAEIWQGFAGQPLSQYRLVFKGVIERMETNEARLRLIIKDQLKLLDKKIPPPQSTSNVLTAPYAGGAQMSVQNGKEFEAPGVVKVEEEYIAFSGIEGNQFTGCVPGCFGSEAAFHPAGTRVRQVTVFAEQKDGSGLPPDEIFLSLLCTHAGLDPLSLAVVERGAELLKGISAEAMELKVSAPEVFPESGVFRVEDELICYRGREEGVLKVRERGAYGTAPAGHAAGTPVRLTRFSEELGRWWAGTCFRRVVENPVAVKELVNELREQCLVHIWQDEEANIAAKCMAPAFYLDPPKILDDETSLLLDSTSWDPGTDQRISRIVIYYDPCQPSAGRRPEAYAGVVVLVEAEAESPNYFGESRGRQVFASWIFREHEALLLASRSLLRSRTGTALFKFALELKDEDLKVGDFVRLNTRDLITPTGEKRGRALFEIIKKHRLSDNRIEYTAVDTKLDRRYPLISPAGLTADYDEASEDGRERFGWIGDSHNRVGASREDGYYIY